MLLWPRGGGIDLLNRQTPVRVRPGVPYQRRSSSIAQSASVLTKEMRVEVPRAAPDVARIAQLNRARSSEGRGRWFDSSSARHDLCRGGVSGRNRLSYKEDDGPKHMWIAATALLCDLPIITTDDDLNQLNGRLITVHWVDPTLGKPKAP